MMAHYRQAALGASSIPYLKHNPQHVLAASRWARECERLCFNRAFSYEDEGRRVLDPLKVRENGSCAATSREA